MAQVGNINTHGGLGGGRPNTVAEATQKIEQEKAQRVAHETPAIQTPPQNVATINLGNRQEPAPTQHTAPVDRHSIKGGAQVDQTPRPSTVIEQRVQNAKAGNPRETAPATTKVARQKEANAEIQARQEQKQNTKQTEQKNNPVAVQTQVGQNINKLT
jgi:hypothetical protein